jgi:class 3 adenylate cyclase
MPAQSPVRKLLAIMFTDIVGYTALMQTDEQKAIRIRNRHREVFNGSHKSYNGQIIQYFGDGTLSTFESALEAVRCAITIQKELHHDEPIPLRIGIHLGDIYYDGTEIYGDGVNVASRVENIALAGSIFITEKFKL